MPFIDIHAHIDLHDPAELPGIIERARAAGVGAIISAGVTLESSGRCAEIAGQFPTVFAGVGVHPEEMTGELTGDGLDCLRRLASDPRVVVLSEAGLDHSPPERFQRPPGASWRPSTGPEWHAVQERAFRAQIGVARENGLAVVFHNRLATEDTLRVLKEERVGELGGAAHYFQGGWGYARALLDLGVHISFARPLLRSAELQEVARLVPPDRIVLETDSFPQPHKRARSDWTEPKDIAVVAAKMAELRGVSVDEVRELTTQNALAMLGRRGGPLRDALAGFQAPPGSIEGPSGQTR